MLDRRVRGAPFVFGFVASLLVSGGALAHGAEVAAVLDGDAYMRGQTADDFAPVKAGTHLAPGNGVRTAADSATEIKVTDGVTLHLAPGSTVTLRAAAVLPAEHPGANPLPSFQLMLNEGEIDVDVHDPNLGMLVQLPNGRSLGVWRGSANVALHGDQVAIGLYEGMAIAGSASKWKALTAGTGVTLSLKGDPSAPHPTPTAPEWTDEANGPPSFAMVQGDERATVGAAWAPAKAAASYRVEIAKSPSMVGAESVMTSDAPSIKTEPLASGSYVARVRAISPEGIVGPRSKPKALRVVRYVVPPSAFVAKDGVIVLAPTAAVTLDDPRDLEVATAYDGSDLTAWSPAPWEIKLGTAQRRDVHIRHAASRGEGRVVLVKRELRAQVSFNPRPARWPGDPIDIVVKVGDTSGYLDPSREKIDVDVRIDIDRVPLQWKHANDTWTARLPPRADGGPWVIRVNVADGAGVPIGSNLLDVDGPPTRAAYRSVDGVSFAR